MGAIYELVQQTLAKGYLNVEAENQLRQLLQTTKYSWEDLEAFMTLQQAAMSGEVRQESREQALTVAKRLYPTDSGGRR